jgi:type IV pilus assembly protein PilV
MGLQLGQHHPSVARGFTLVEVLMAMLVMTVGLLGLLQSVNVAFEHNTRNRLRQEALLVGEEQMNDLRRTANSALSYPNFTCAVRVVAGVNKKFSVIRDCQQMQDSNRLSVRVGWSFKNVSATQVIYTLKRK